MACLWGCLKNEGISDDLEDLENTLHSLIFQMCYGRYLILTCKMCLKCPPLGPFIHLFVVGPVYNSTNAVFVLLSVLCDFRPCYVPMAFLPFVQHASPSQQPYVT